MTTPSVVGLVLAAGAGRRLGGPKALVTDSDGTTWLARTVAALRDGGVDDVYVVVGASADVVSAAAPGGCRVVGAEDWTQGMGASLRTGLDAVTVERSACDAVLVMLVDTPGVGGEVVRRLAALASPAVLARAAYDSEPGHPVLIGREHWADVATSARGDRGARDYLRSQDAALVECGDVGSGVDIDTPDRLDNWRDRP